MTTITIGLPLLHLFLLDEIHRAGGSCKAGDLSHAVEQFHHNKRLIAQSEIESELQKLVEEGCLKIEKIPRRGVFYKIVEE